MEENTYYEYRNVKLKYRGIDFIGFLLLFYYFMERKFAWRNTQREKQHGNLKRKLDADDLTCSTTQVTVNFEDEILLKGGELWDPKIKIKQLLEHT